MTPELSPEEYRPAANLAKRRNFKMGVAYTAAATMCAEVPEFQYRLPDSTLGLDQAVLGIVLLLAWCLAALSFASRHGRAGTGQDSNTKHKGPTATPNCKLL